jgi:hypothetical protein
MCATSICRWSLPRPHNWAVVDLRAERRYARARNYLRVIRPFLTRVGFPDVTVVRYQPRTAPYQTLEGQCLHTGTLPSLAYGGKSCSLK